jgi:ADP-ribose pyrophosphatase
MPELKEVLISSETVFKGKFIRVAVDTIKMPDGRLTTRDCVRHPGAVAVLPIFEDGSVVMVDQYRHAPGQVFTEIPAGKVEAGQSIKETAHRELEEETGLVAAELIWIGKYHPCIGYSDEIIDFFIALNCTKTQQHFDDDELLYAKNMLFKEVVAQCANGEQTDSKTLAGVIRVRNWWKKNGPFPLDLGEL